LAGRAGTVLSLLHSRLNVGLENSALPDQRNQLATLKNSASQSMNRRVANNPISRRDSE
jgi:hypothetical protein